MGARVVAAGLALLVAWPVCDGAPRSRVLLRDFQREHPCPANDKRRGPCPGFQIDHIQPLCAGGPDALENLHWLALAEHEAKTRKDVTACAGRAYRSP